MEISDKLNDLINNLGEDDSDSFYYFHRDYTGSLDYLDIENKGGKAIFTALPNNVKTDNPLDCDKRHQVKFASMLQKGGLEENEARRILEQLTAMVLVGTNVEVVEGEEIRNVYRESGASGGANLDSCMTGEDVIHYCDMYVYNPNSIKLAVLRIGKTVLARAIIFTGFSSHENMLSRTDPKLLMGRIYFMANEHRVTLESWGKKNVDYFLSGGQSYEVNQNPNDCSNRNWYIPLDYWLLNYYPYPDHFYRIGRGFITNSNKSYMHEGKKCSDFILAGGDAPPSSPDFEYFPLGNEPILDPFRPGMYFLEDDDCWQPIGNRVWTNLGWTRMDQATKCKFCDTHIYVGLRSKSEQSCGAHKTITVDGKLLLADGLCKLCNKHAMKIAELCGHCDRYYIKSGDSFVKKTAAPVLKQEALSYRVVVNL